MAETIEGKSRLVCLAYQVLNKIDVVVAGKTDGELMAVMVAAFQRHADEVAAAESRRHENPSVGGLPAILRAAKLERGDVARWPLSRFGSRTARAAI